MAKGIVRCPLCGWHYTYEQLAANQGRFFCCNPPAEAGEQG